ncbi:hypothetical protein [Sinomonas sp. P10A9]|uniref:Uncharacterized protein n=1 Tax=Sinomonas puerhi TaxID=3238584 RepID=A0AB39L0M0_9MICC
MSWSKDAEVRANVSRIANAYQMDDVDEDVLELQRRLRVKVVKRAIIKDAKHIPPFRAAHYELLIAFLRECIENLNEEEAK